MNKEFEPDHLLYFFRIATLFDLFHPHIYMFFFSFIHFPFIFLNNKNSSPLSIFCFVAFRNTWTFHTMMDPSNVPAHTCSPSYIIVRHFTGVPKLNLFCMVIRKLSKFSMKSLCAKILRCFLCCLFNFAFFESISQTIVLSSDCESVFIC